MSAKRTQKVALPAIVDLDSLDDIRDRLIDALDAGSVSVDAGAVDRVATNALIMLLSAAETAAHNNRSLSLEHVSEPMVAAIARLGLSNRFDAFIEGH